MKHRSERTMLGNTEGSRAEHKHVRFPVPNCPVCSPEVYSLFGARHAADVRVMTNA